jgi:CheY-like chemotaxis protein
MTTDIDKQHPLKVLVVDDSHIDQKLLKIAFLKAEIPVEMTFCSSGKEALELLFPEDKKITPQPMVCFLDLSMPAITGFDVLKEIKSNKQTQHISVFIFSSSDRDEDIRRSYKNGANGYLVKPLQQKELFNLVQNLSSLWTGPYRFSDAPKNL